MKPEAPNSPRSHNNIDRALVMDLVVAFETTVVGENISGTENCTDSNALSTALQQMDRHSFDSSSSSSSSSLLEHCRKHKPISIKLSAFTLGTLVSKNNSHIFFVTINLFSAFIIAKLSFFFLATRPMAFIANLANCSSCTSLTYSNNSSTIFAQFCASVIKDNVLNLHLLISNESALTRT